MTQVLAAFIAIPFGVSVLMRGSDGLNRGTLTSGEAGMMAGVGGALILTSLAMLIGFRDAGVLTAIALLVGAVAALRRQRRRTGRLEAGQIVSAFALPVFLIILIAAGL